MCTERLWAEIETSLESRFYIVHLHIPLERSLDEIVDDFQQMLPSDANVIGFSLGAYLACYLATQYPEKIGRLFMISNSPCELNELEMKQRKSALAWVEKHGYLGISQRKAKSLVDESRINESVTQTILEMDHELGEAVFKSQIRLTTERKDLFEPLSVLNLPIHFIYSENDALVNQEWIRRFVQCSFHAESTVVEGSGHMLPLECPQLLVEQIERSLI